MYVANSTKILSPLSVTVICVLTLLVGQIFPTHAEIHGESFKSYSFFKMMNIQLDTTCAGMEKTFVAICIYQRVRIYHAAFYVHI